MRTPKPLLLELKPSRGLAAYLMLVHGLVGGVLLVILPSALAALGLIAAVFSGRYYWRRYIDFAVPEAVPLLKFADNRWQVLCSGAQKFESVEWLDATILRYLVVLRFRDLAGRGVNVCILADQLDPEVFRRLRQVAGFARLSHPL